MEKITNFVESLIEALRTENYFEETGRFVLTSEELLAHSKELEDNDELIEKEVGTRFIEENLKGEWSIITGRYYIQSRLMSAFLSDNTNTSITLPGGKKFNLKTMKYKDGKILAYINDSDIAISYGEKDNLNEVIDKLYPMVH